MVRSRRTCMSAPSSHTTPQLSVVLFSDCADNRPITLRIVPVRSPAHTSSGRLPGPSPPMISCTCIPTTGVTSRPTTTGRSPCGSCPCAPLRTPPAMMFTSSSVLQYERGSADLYVFGSPKNTEGYQFSKTFFGVIFANNPIEKKT